MMPADQRLEADDLAGDQRLRLVVQRQFLAQDRRLQVLLQATPLAQPLVHVGFEHPEYAAAVGLGAIERGVGIAEQRRRVGAVVREERHADAEPDAKGVALELEIVRRRSPSAGRRAQWPFRLRTVDDQRELVAADAGEKSAAGGRSEALAHLAQQRVAGRMAEHVVDVLEAIEVEAQHRERLRRRERRARA